MSDILLEKIKVGALIVVSITLIINTYYVANQETPEIPEPTATVGGGNARGGSGAANTNANLANPAASNPTANTAQFNPNTGTTTPNLTATPQVGNTATPATTPASTGPKTAIQFAGYDHDFGQIKQDTENKHVFKFTNNGDEPLIISDAKGSCGCTVPNYPKQPIMPGKVGEIEVVYRPAKQKGAQTKTITVTANTEPANTILKISADVQEL